MKKRPILTMTKQFSIRRLARVGTIAAVLACLLFPSAALKLVHAAPEADLAIYKSVNPLEVVAGEYLFYNFTVVNNGPNTATNVTVTDTLPQGTNYAAATAACINPQTGTLTFLLGDMSASASQTFTLKVSVGSNYVLFHGPTITNWASMSSNTDDPNQIDNEVSVTSFVREEADLSVMKLSKPDETAFAGELVNYTIIVENLGPSFAHDVYVADEIRSSGAFTFLSFVAPNYQVSPSPPKTGQFVKIVATRNGGIDPGLREVIQITVRANESQDIDDIAIVGSAMPDPDLSNNQAQKAISVTAVADLKLTKTATPASLPYPNRTLNYTLTVVNNGPSTATNVIIKDWLSQELSINKITPSKGSCNFGVPGDALQPTVCNIGSLAPGESATVLISTTITTPTTTLRSDVVSLRDDACVSSDTYDPDNSNNLASKIVLAGSPATALTSSTDPSNMIAIALTTSIGLASLMFAMRMKKVDPVSLVRKRLGFPKKPNTA